MFRSSSSEGRYAMQPVHHPRPYHRPLYHKPHQYKPHHRLFSDPLYSDSWTDEKSNSNAFLDSSGNSNMNSFSDSNLDMSSWSSNSGNSDTDSNSDNSDSNRNSGNSDFSDSYSNTGNSDSDSNSDSSDLSYSKGVFSNSDAWDSSANSNSDLFSGHSGLAEDSNSKWFLQHDNSNLYNYNFPMWPHYKFPYWGYHDPSYLNLYRNTHFQYPYYYSYPSKGFRFSSPSESAFSGNSGFASYNHMKPFDHSYYLHSKWNRLPYYDSQGDFSDISGNSNYFHDDSWSDVGISSLSFDSDSVEHPYHSDTFDSSGGYDSSSFSELLKGSDHFDVDMSSSNVYVLPKKPKQYYMRGSHHH